MTDRSLSVIIFAFDEAENIAPVLGELREWLAANEPDAEIVFVDDGSRDRTSEVAAAVRTLRDAQRRTFADVVFSVYDDRNDGLDRKVFSLGVRSLILAVHGVWMRSDGPYLFRRSLFDPDQLPPDTFFLNFEFPIRIMAARRPTTVVTIRCRPRRAGQSKSTQWHRILGVAKDLVDLRVRRTRERVRRARDRRASPNG